MKIHVLDSDAAMREVVAAPLPERAARLRRMLEPMAGMYRYFPGEPDLVALHHVSSGFRVDRDDERVLPALDALRAADAWGRIERALHEGLARQLEATPGIATP
ncbi:MAG TPA: peptidase, partial [Pseudonocardia sp.]|nr:peptidase [Pseudonocardia sp.]